MAIVQNLSLLALRPTIVAARADPAAGKDAETLTALLTQRFVALGPRLSAALHTAAERSWRVLEIALSGPAGWARGQALLNTADDQPLRDAVRTFLDSAFVGELPDGGAFARQECARELHAARRSGVFDDFVDEQGLARQAVTTWFTAVEPAPTREAEKRIVEQLAGSLRTAGYGHLARNLEVQSQSGTTALGAALRASFRRVVDKDEALRQNLPWTVADTATEPHLAALAAITEALDRHARRIHDLIEVRALEVGAAGLDLGTELKQLPPALQPVAHDVLQLIGTRQLEHRELRATDFLTAAGDDERRRVQLLSARLRTVPEEQRRQSPALLNALAKLEALAGDLAAAEHSFHAAANLVTDLQAQAEVHANIYQVALERRHWSEALEALKRAAARDPERFAPFPLAKYEPETILRHDAFGVTFFCRHRTAAVSVVVRTLRPEVLERSVADIFHEAQVLEALEQPAILRPRDCDFADAAQTRPYLVHDHFEGQTLAEYVEQHGPVPPGEMLHLGRSVAEALQAAHAKNVLHRLLNPTSLLVRKDPAGWRVKLLNFGLALKGGILRAALVNPAARVHSTIGRDAARCLDYAAPEQLGRLPDVPLRPYTDIYSFGRTCYFALLRTPEPDDEEKESLPAGWRKLLGHSTALVVSRRPPTFEPIVQRLTTHPAEPVAAAAKPEVRPPAVAATTTAVTPPRPVRPAPEVPAPAPRPARLPDAPAIVPTPRAEVEEASACVQRGVALRMKGEFDPALAEFTRAVKLDAKNPLAYEGRGNTYVNKGDYDRAIADYNAALKLDARLALVYVNRGLAYVKKKDSEQAIADYTAAIQIDAKLPLAYLNRGSAYARKGDYDRAIADYNAALHLDKDLVLGFFNRGLAFAKKGEHERAMADYNQVLKFDPGNAQAKVRLQESEQARRQPTTGSTPTQPTTGSTPTQPTTGSTPTQPTTAGAPAASAPTQAVAPPQIGHVRQKKKPPESMVARQVRQLDGHTDPVRSVAFMPDGRRVVSASEDKTIRLWDLKSGKTMVRYLGHTGGVTSVAVAPNGERLLSGSQDHTLRLWDIDNGQEIRRFGASRFFGGGNAHADAVVSVAFSPDGLRAISASWDKTLRLWDVESGKELRAYEGHQWLIHSVAFSPDGQHFLYGSEDQTARLCEVETGQEIRRFEGHTSWVLSVAFAPDGRQVLTGSADGSLRMWSVARGREMRRYGGNLGLVQCVAYGADGKFVLSGEYSPAKQETILFMWNAETGDEVTRLTGHQQLIWGVAFSPDGKYALTGSADTSVRLWRLPR